jgi:small nuclear ribonucleoprotein B and B'
MFNSLQTCDLKTQMSAAPRGSKLAKFLNHRVSVSIGDHRYFIGQMLGFDSHSNVVLKDCEEYRQLKKRKAGETREAKRNIGLMILRGDSVVHIDVIGPPPPSGNRMAASTAAAVLQPGLPAEKAGKGAGVPAATVPANLTGLSKPGPGVAAPSAKVLPSSALPR